MLTLDEWNEVLDYANRLEKDVLNSTMRFKPYTLYDGSKGLYLQRYDYNGNLFDQYATGIHSTVKDYISVITRMVCKFV